MADESSVLIPTTQIWPSEEISKMTDQQYSAYMYQQMNNIVLSLSTRSIGYYDTKECMTGNSFFTDSNQNGKQSFRTFINFGLLKNGPGPTSITHYINFNTTYTAMKISGCATDSTANIYLPLPYSSATAADIIELYVDATKVYIIVGKDRSTYTAYVVIEYIKN